MKPIKIKKSASDDQEYLIGNPPYTIYGSSEIPDSFCITMKAGGLRKMLDKFELDNDDTFRIEVFSNRHEYSFIKDKVK